MSTALPIGVAEALGSGNIGAAINASQSEQSALTLTGDAAETVSYTDLRARVNATQSWLLTKGLRPGASVAIISENSIDFIVAFFAIMRAGGVAVPISYKLPGTALKYVLNNSDSRLALVDRTDRIPAELHEGLEVHLLANLGELGEPSSTEQLAPAAVEGSDPAMILYTSGSTGNPKGVVRSHASHEWIMEVGERYSDGRHRVLLVAAPLYHMNALATVQAALLHGDHVVLQPVFDARGFLQAISDHRVTRITGVPPMMALALRERRPDTDLSSVNEVWLGSAPMSDELIEESKRVFPGAIFSLGYGTTESGPVAFAPHPSLATPRGSVGIAHPEVKVELRDANGAVLTAEGNVNALDEDIHPQNTAALEGRSVTGELCLSSPAQMLGYKDRPDVPNPIDERGFYVTGDLFERDGQGFYFFRGRVDDMFTSGGENVYPAAVEKVLERHPGVQEAAVVPVADALKGAKPVAFVVPVPGTHATEIELRAWSLENLEPYAHPRRIFFMDGFPLSGTNKVDKKFLAARAEELIGARR